MALAIAPQPEQTALTEDERSELLRCEWTISKSFIDIALSLETIQTKHLYREYGTWTSYLQSRWGWNSDSVARQYRIALRVYNEVKTVTGVTIESKTQGVELNSALRHVPDEYRAEVLQVAAQHAQETNQRLSKPLIQRAQEVVEQSKSGYVDTGNGSHTPVNAALMVEDYEAMMRQRQHIRENSRWAYVSHYQTCYKTWELRDFIEWFNGLEVQPEENIKVVVMREKVA